MAYTEKFLAAFRQAGSRGLANYELSEIALQYNFEIHVLRKKGFDIQKKRVYRDGKPSQTWVYFLVEEQYQKPKIDHNNQPKAISWLDKDDL